MGQNERDGASSSPTWRRPCWPGAAEAETEILGPTTTSILRKPGDANKQKTFILQKKPQGAPLCHSIAYILLIKLTSRHPPNPPPNPSKNLEDFLDSHSCTWPGDPGDPSLVTLVTLVTLVILVILVILPW